MKTGSSKRLIVKGYLVNELGQQSEGKKYLTIENGVISSISDDVPPLNGDELTFELSESQVIFPGFLDLHTHIEYNMLPNWDSEHSPWDNRHQWRNNEKYINDIPCVRDYIINSWNESRNDATDDLRMLGEIQAIAGGTTVVQETADYNSTSGKPNEHILIRSTGRCEDLGFDTDDLILSVVDFYKPDVEPSGVSNLDTSAWVPKEQDKLTYFKRRVSKEFICATLVHLSEGRSGFIRKETGTDGYTRKEFETFMQEMKQFDPAVVAQRHISVIHGCGIDVLNNEHLQFLKDYGISILWAPISNSLLYKDTIDVFAFVDFGINVALGSDWSPSGGKHAWEEAKFAFWLCRRLYPLKDEAQLMSQIYQMITSGAGRCFNSALKFGVIAEHSPGDLVIINKMEGKSALETLFYGNDSSVYCVVVNGRILYGCEEAFKNIKLDFDTAVDVDYQSFPPMEGYFAANKYISVNRSLNFNILESTEKLERILQNEGCPRKWSRSRYLASDDLEYLNRIELLKSEMDVTLN